MSGINGKNGAMESLSALLVSGINGKNGAMQSVTDHKSRPAGSIPVSANRHGINKSKIIPPASQNLQVDAHDRE
jgi:hypothetical protein